MQLLADLLPALGMGAMAEQAHAQRSRPQWSSQEAAPASAPLAAAAKAFLQSVQGERQRRRAAAADNRQERVASEKDKEDEEQGLSGSGSEGSQAPGLVEDQGQGCGLLLDHTPQAVTGEVALRMALVSRSGGHRNWKDLPGVYTAPGGRRRGPDSVHMGRAFLRSGAVAALPSFQDSQYSPLGRMSLDWVVSIGDPWVPQGQQLQGIDACMRVVWHGAACLARLGWVCIIQHAARSWACRKCGPAWPACMQQVTNPHEAPL